MPHGSPPRSLFFPFFPPFFQTSNLHPKDTLPRWLSVWMCDAFSGLFLGKEGCFHVCESISAYVLFTMNQHMLWDIKKLVVSPLGFCINQRHRPADLTRGFCTCAFFTPVFVCRCPRRGAMEPVVMWRCEDDHHSGCLNNSNQHCDHPSLGMEQLHLWRWPQAEVPLFPGAEEHVRLPEVCHWMNSLGASTSRWTAGGITSSREWTRCRKGSQRCCFYENWAGKTYSKQCCEHILQRFMLSG